MGGAIRTAAGAHHFRFVGLEVKPLAGALAYSLIELGTGSETSEALLPHDIVIDRCYVHGNPGEASGRGVALNGKSLAVIDSTLADFKDQDFDTQAIMGWNGPGPFKIVNNYLEAAGENVMFGGADPSIANLVPSDIEIRGNHFFKPTSWRGVWAAVKNLFELKNARRVLVEGNVFENIWLAAQAGFAVQLTVRNQDGTAPWSTIEDVTIRKNIVRHAAAGVNILAADDPNPSQTMKRVLLQGNLFDDITGSTWGGQGRLFQILGWAAGSTDLVIEHNTGVQTENLNYSDGLAHLGFIYRNNLTPRGDAGFGFIGTGAAEGLPTLTVYFPLAVFLRNVIAGGNAVLYPPENYFPASLAAVGFVDLAGRNYRLAASSPYKNAATDSTDIGADIDARGSALWHPGDLRHVAPHDLPDRSGRGCDRVGHHRDGVGHRRRQRRRRPGPVQTRRRRPRRGRHDAALHRDLEHEDRHQRRALSHRPGLRCRRQPGLRRSCHRDGLQRYDAAHRGHLLTRRRPDRVGHGGNRRRRRR